MALGVALFSVGFDSLYALFGCCLFVGVGNGLSLPTASAGVMSVRPHLAGSAAGLSGALAQGGGALFAALSGALVAATLEAAPSESASGALALLSFMLFAAVAGLLAALYVRWIDKVRETERRRRRLAAPLPQRRSIVKHASSSAASPQSSEIRIVMKARVHITLKNGVLDPQGAAIQMALTGLGFDGIENVRQGKLIEIDLADVDPSAAKSKVEAMCEKLLANTVIETYAVEIV